MSSRKWLSFLFALVLLLTSASACLLGQGKACENDTSCPEALACIEGWCLPKKQFNDLKGKSTTPTNDAGTQD